MVAQTNEAPMAVRDQPAAAPPELVGTKPTARSHVRWLFVGGALVVLAVVGLLIYSRSSRAAEYVTARIDRGDIDAVVTTTGTLNAVTTVQVGSQVSGNIVALYADFNTRVKKGQLVAQIDPAPFKAAVEQASASLTQAKAAVVTAQATLAKSQSDLASAEANIVSQQANLVKAQSAVNLARVENDRRQIMVVNGSTSQEDADTSKANYEQAVAGVQAAQAALNAAQAAAESARKAVDVAKDQLDEAKANIDQDQAILAQAQLNLDHTRILAPVDGTVESRNMDVGQTVAASFQAPVIFLIAQDLTKMQVDTNVDEADVGPVRLGQVATFTVDAYPGQIFQGKVWQIRQAPINVQNVITYDVVVQVSNPELKLFPGMTANSTLFTGHVSNVLRIPKAALRYHPRIAAGGRAKSTPSPTPKQPGALQPQFVYALDKTGQPKPVRVRLGLSDANYSELVSGGLVEGQPLVTGTAGQAGAASSGSSGQGGGSTKKLGF